MGGGTGERGRQTFPPWNYDLANSLAGVSHGDGAGSRNLVDSVGGFDLFLTVVFVFYGSYQNSFCLSRISFYIYNDLFFFFFLYLVTSFLEK